MHDDCTLGDWANWASVADRRRLHVACHQHTRTRTLQWNGPVLQLYRTDRFDQTHLHRISWRRRSTSHSVVTDKRAKSSERTKRSNPIRISADLAHIGLENRSVRCNQRRTSWKSTATEFRQTRLNLNFNDCGQFQFEKNIGWSVV